MSQQTFVEDDFEAEAESIVEHIKEIINHHHYEGTVEWDTYKENESPIDVEMTIRGAWADLTAVAVAIQEHDKFTAATFALSDDGPGRVIVGLTFHPDVEGLFEYRNY